MYLTPALHLADGDLINYWPLAMLVKSDALISDFSEKIWENDYLTVSLHTPKIFIACTYVVSSFCYLICIFASHVISFEYTYMYRIILKTSHHFTPLMFKYRFLFFEHETYSSNDKKRFHVFLKLLYWFWNVFWCINL